MPTYIRFEHCTDDRLSKEYGPYEYAQLTYDVLRVDDGEELAAYCTLKRHGPEFWYITDDIDNQPWSDVVIYAKE